MATVGTSEFRVVVIVLKMWTRNLFCYRYFTLECAPCRNCLCLFSQFDICQCPFLCTLKWGMVEWLWMMDQECSVWERKQLLA